MTRIGVLRPSSGSWGLYVRPLCGLAGVWERGLPFLTAVSCQNLPSTGTGGSNQSLYYKQKFAIRNHTPDGSFFTKGMAEQKGSNSISSATGMACFWEDRRQCARPGTFVVWLLVTVSSRPRQEVPGHLQRERGIFQRYSRGISLFPNLGFTPWDEYQGQTGLSNFQGGIFPNLLGDGEIVGLD